MSGRRGEDQWSRSATPDATPRTGFPFRIRRCGQDRNECQRTSATGGVAGAADAAPHPVRATLRVMAEAASADAMTPAGERLDLFFLTAVALMAALALADVIGGREANMSAVLVVGPVLAAAGSRPGRVAVASGLALVGSLAFGVQDRLAPTAFSIRVAAVITGGLIAIWVAAQREERERALTTVRHVAEVAQSTILVSPPRAIGPLRFAAEYHSASEGARIGGDFYEVVARADGARLVVGDVRGKGLDAVRTAAVAIWAFREAAERLDDIEEVAAVLDQRLARHLGAEDFVTAIIADIDGHGGACFVNCGHHPPLRLGRGAPVAIDAPPTTPLGLAPVPRRSLMQLAPGERLLFYTDGLVEARERDGRFVDVDTLLAGLGPGPLDQVLATLTARMHAALGGHADDDLALLVVEYAGDGTDSAGRSARAARKT